MTPRSAFIGFVIKELRHVFRDRRTLLVLFGMPVTMMLLFGFVIRNEIKDAQIGILDLARDDVSRKVIDKIASSGYFRVESYLQSMEEVPGEFRKGRIKEVLVFEQDFGRQLIETGKAKVQIIGDASDYNQAKTLNDYTTAILMDFGREFQPGVPPGSLLQPEVRMVYNPQLKSVYMFVPGIMAIILMLVSALMTSVSIAREKETGTMEVLLVSPLRPFQIVAGKVFPYLGLSFVNALVIIGLSVWVFDLPVAGNIGLLLFTCFLFILLALSLGILISTVAASQQAAMFVSMVGLMLPTMLLSGFIYPIDNMPVILQVLCRAMPPTYFIEAVKTIMLKGGGLLYVWDQLLVISGFIAVFVIITIRKFKIRLE